MKNENKPVLRTDPEIIFFGSWAAIQRRGSIWAWIVILSVYGADTIAEVMLLISPFLR